jgi:hypothetical protein
MNTISIVIYKYTVRTIKTGANNAVQYDLFNLPLVPVLAWDLRRHLPAMHAFLFS